MLYWPFTPGAVYDIAIPKSKPLTAEELADGNIHIHLRNEVGRWEIDGGDWDWDETPLYILLHCVNDADPEPGYFPPAGEYTYEAFVEIIDPDGDGYSHRLISTGLAVFGDYGHAIQQYEDNETIYEQYGNE